MDERRAPPGDESIAIAIKGGGREQTELPRIVASGQGAIAEQILEIAFAEGVKVRTDADLTEILSAVDVDSEIPLEALATVAEILSYVYRAQGGAGSGAEGAETAHENGCTTSETDVESHVE